MAFAETAELAVRLKLEAAAYERGMKSATAATTSFGRTAGAIGGHIKSGIGSALTNLTKIGLIAGAAVGAGLATQVRSGIDSLRELDAVTRQTNAVLKSTKGVAGETGASIRALAEKYEDLNATMDDKVIQSGANLLLTFTSIRKQAFEPTLKAALDLNEAMGGGEAGLQGTIIQVGKALQDPIRGLTALRRVGVNFSKDQEKQIKDLIKHNDLWGAQKIILAELTKEFGGSFAQAGKSADGTFAKLGDTIEDLQMSLASALLPALVEVAKELSTTFNDPSIKSGVKELGKGLGEAFKNAVTFAKQIDWKAIGGGLRTAASAAGTLVQKFNEAPDWLKTAVITGWGLNKLTGGALTGIGGEIAKGIGGQFLMRGSSPANPMWVQSTGGPGVPGGPGGIGIGGAAVALGGTVALQGVANQFAGGPNPYNLPTQQSGFGPQLLDINALAAKGRGGGPVAPDTAAMGQWVTQVTGDFARIDQTAKAFNVGVSRMAEASLDAAEKIEKDWLKTIDPDKIGERSKAKSGRDATPAQIAAIRSRDILHQIQVITEKSKASSDKKLERLQVLAADAKAHGDTKTAAKVNKAIADMKTKIAAQEALTKGAVGAASGAIVGAIAEHQSDINVYVTTTVTASDIATTTIQKYRMGPGAGSSNGSSNKSGAGIN